MITDIHVHHVPEPFARFVEKAAPYLMHRDPPSGEMITLNVGPLRYGLSRTFFDPERDQAHAGNEGGTCGPFARYSICEV